MSSVCLSPLVNWIVCGTAGVPIDTVMFSSVKVNSSLACWTETESEVQRESRLCACFVVLHVWGPTSFAGSSSGVSSPGSETFTDFRSMFTNFNWVCEGDGKVGKVFWKSTKAKRPVFNLKRWSGLSCVIAFLLTSISSCTRAAQTNAIAAKTIPTVILFRGLLMQREEEHGFENTALISGYRKTSAASALCNWCAIYFPL